jgi:hypothetical protein
MYIYIVCVCVLCVVCCVCLYFTILANWQVSAITSDWPSLDYFITSLLHYFITSDWPTLDYLIT